MARPLSQCIWLLLIAASFAGSADAQEAEPFAEVSITPEEVAVGEPVTLRVSVYVPTWFAKPPTFPSFEIPNAITRLPPDSSRSVSRRIGRDTWSGITRRYQVYPLMGARFRLDSQAIDIQYANPGSDPERVQLETGDVAFTAVVPAGAESLDPYVAGTRLALSRSVDGDAASLAVGDAVVVTYTAELDGLSAIFIPEIVVAPEAAGVSVYPDQAVVNDGPPASRSETLTFIFNAGGDFEIPAVAIDWWNTETESVQTASLPPLQVNVAGPPIETVSDEPRSTINWQLIAVLVAGLLVVLRWLPTATDRLRSAVRAREARRRASEPYAWQRVRKALAGGNAQHAHEQLVRWIGRLEADLDVREFAARFGDESLGSEIDTMYRSLYADTRERPDLDRIAAGLSAARKRFLSERVQQNDSVLPTLNP